MTPRDTLHSSPDLDFKTSDDVNDEITINENDDNDEDEDERENEVIEEEKEEEANDDNNIEEEDNPSNSDNERQSTTPTFPIDPYLILNISRDADLSCIDASYRRLSRAFHPDKAVGQSGVSPSVHSFHELQKAKDILSDPVLRMAYDDLGETGVNLVLRGNRGGKGGDGGDGGDDSSDDDDSDDDDHTDCDSDEEGSGHGEGSDNSRHSGIYNDLLKLHEGGKSEDARIYLRRVVQARDYEVATGGKGGEWRPSGEVQISCILDERNISPSLSRLSLIEVDSTVVRFSVGSGEGSVVRKRGWREPECWSTSFGGTAFVGRDGSCQSSTQISASCVPVGGTNVNADIELGEHPKLTLGTSRITSGRTHLTASIGTMPDKSPLNLLALSFSSHRSLFRDRFRGSWALGLGTDMSPHYSMLSFTMLPGNNEEDNDRNKSQKQGIRQLWRLLRLSYPPQFTLRLGSGIDRFPIRLVMEGKRITKIKENFTRKRNLGPVIGKKIRKDYINNGSGGGGGEYKFILGWGPSGVETEGILTRHLAKYCSIGMGLRCDLWRDLKFNFSLKRGSMALKIPLALRTFAVTGSIISRYGYITTTVYASLITFLIDAIVEDVRASGITEKEDKVDSIEPVSECDYYSNNIFVATFQKYVLLQQKQELQCHVQTKFPLQRKSSEDAKFQVSLMTNAALAKRKKEENVILEAARGNGGLVILEGIYSVEGGRTLDVTTVLQFFVEDSRLSFPAVTKVGLLGFCDVRNKEQGGLLVDVSPIEVDKNDIVGRIYCTIVHLLQSFIPNGKIITRADQLRLQPTLKVRYKTWNGIYEICVNDEEELYLPSRYAIRLGGENVL